MKLSELAAKPQLKEITIDNKEIVEKYGDSLQFYVHDRFDMETFTKIAGVDQKDPGKLYEIVRDLILDENSMPVMSDGNVLPMDVMMAAVEKVTDSLGK